MGPVERILRRARNLIRTTGWCQFSFARVQGNRSANWSNPEATCFCAEGAILKASESIDPNFKNRDAARASRTVRRALSKHHDFNGSIPSWNDHAFRRKQHVLVLLGQAADMAAEEGL